MLTESIVQELEAASSDFRALWAALGRHGVLRALGADDGLPETAALLEDLGFELEEGGVFISLIGGVALALPILARAGGSEHARSYRERALSGDAILAVAITEPEAGSDALAMRTALRERDGRLVLSGRKWNITNAPIADGLIVFCRDETVEHPHLCAVLVPADARGVTRDPALELIAARNSPTGAFTLEDVEVDPAWVLGRRDDGHALLDLAFLRERLLAPFPILGRASRAIQEGIDWATGRRQFGRSIGEFQYVQRKVVESYEAVETARLLAEEAIARAASGRAAWAHASLAKARAADTGREVFRAMIELRGSYGVQAEARLGEAMLDAVCGSIAGGTRELQHKVVWDQLVLDRGRARRAGRTKLFRRAAPDRRDATRRPDDART